MHWKFLHSVVLYIFKQRFLGDYTQHNFEEAVNPLIEKFQNKLQEISDAIKARNESLEFPYFYLLPERIPSSVAIWNRVIKKRFLLLVDSYDNEL